MQLMTVPVEKDETTSVILGQSHFIKTVEDIHEVMVGSVPGVRFGIAFCEASGDRLVRVSGTDDGLKDLAARNAQAIGAGHTFVLLIAEGAYPINVLNAIKTVPEVCGIFCATANRVEAVIGESDLGRGILGVIDGQPPVGVESAQDASARRDLLRVIGYKL